MKTGWNMDQSMEKVYLANDSFPDVPVAEIALDEFIDILGQLKEFRKLKSKASIFEPWPEDSPRKK